MARSIKHNSPCHFHERKRQTETQSFQKTVWLCDDDVDVRIWWWGEVQNGKCLCVWRSEFKLANGKAKLEKMMKKRLVQNGILSLSHLILFVWMRAWRRRRSGPWEWEEGKGRGRGGEEQKCLSTSIFPLKLYSISSSWRRGDEREEDACSQWGIFLSLSWANTHSLSISHTHTSQASISSHSRLPSWAFEEAVSLAPSPLRPRDPSLMEVYGLQRSFLYLSPSHSFSISFALLVPSQEWITVNHLLLLRTTDARDRTRERASSSCAANWNSNCRQCRLNWSRFP